MEQHLVEQLSGQDASFIYSEMPKSPMHIGGLCIYDPSTIEGGKQRFKDILGFIEDRLHLAKTFRRKLVKAIPGLPTGSYAVFTKIHHACIDGVSGVDITEAIHSLTPYPDKPEPPEVPWSGEQEPNPVELVTRAQFNNMTQPFRFAEVMARAIPAVGRFQ